MGSHLGRQLRDELLDYLSGELSKKEFKTHLRNIEQSEDGANWFTIFAAIDGILKDPSEADHLKLLEVYIEVFPNGDWETRYGSDMVEKVSN